ncbi:MAG: 3-oxoacyl-ACP reductase FabG [Planctomycetota bacterium]|nr:MAG: 3-oxoacyl-ACP reductase FabG [Planctomycetota bacterium]
MRLKDKVAIITGAGRGLGQAFALRFADEGAQVVIAEIDQANGANIAKEIEAKGGQALALCIDVSNEDSTQEMAKKTMERFGKIDILVNNAALIYKIGVKPWDDRMPEDWDRIFAVNVKGSWLCCKAVVPHMIPQGGGSIINITSSTHFSAEGQLIHYTCSKGAVISLTRVLARELGGHNIRVNAMSPGRTLSESSLDQIGVPPNVEDMVIQTRCLKRSEQPDDLPGTAVFLASDDSAFITGQTIIIDGGGVFL